MMLYNLWIVINIFDRCTNVISKYRFNNIVIDVCDIELGLLEFGDIC